MVDKARAWDSFQKRHNRMQDTLTFDEVQEKVKNRQPNRSPEEIQNEVENTLIRQEELHNASDLLETLRTKLNTINDIDVEFLLEQKRDTESRVNKLNGLLAAVVET
jgi:hypothetical protein